jgi:hypothetical protein
LFFLIDLRLFFLIDLRLFFLIDLRLFFLIDLRLPPVVINKLEKLEIASVAAAVAEPNPLVAAAVAEPNPLVAAAVAEVKVLETVSVVELDTTGLVVDGGVGVGGGVFILLSGCVSLIIYILP